MSSCMTRQQGVTLLIIAIILMLASASYIIASVSQDEVKIDRQIENIKALSKAKRALIAHGLTNSYRTGNLAEIGNLPCPDVSNISPEGDQDPNCGGSHENTIGYFPWKRMGVEVLRDVDGNCLLYAVSPSYKLNPPRMLNQDSVGMFQIVDTADNVVEGVVAGDRPVAVVFAPNEIVNAQSRNFDATSHCGKDFGNLSAYLDDSGVRNNSAVLLANNTIDKFVHATSTSVLGASALNDTFVTISQSEIWDNILTKTDLVTKLTELTEALAVCLTEYANSGSNSYRQLPWPAPVDLGGEVDSYLVDVNYDDVDAAALGYAGRFPYMIDSSNIETGMTIVNIFDTPACAAINLPSTAAVEAINLNDGKEYKIVWDNWKDHFYYALSKKYEPDSSAVADSVCDGLSGCVSVAGAANEYAAVVFFGNVTTNNVTRTDGEVVGDDDEKSIIGNYLENGNDAVFTDVSGEGNFNSNTPPGNDVMFCIENTPTGDDLTVTAC